MTQDRFIFRGKSIIDGDWVNGFLIQGDSIQASEINQGKAFIVDCVGGELEVCEVDPKTVGQCTGLRDKNGVLIFEGDILKSEDPFLKLCGTVGFGDQNSLWAGCYYLEGIENNNLLCNALEDYDLCVSGNIHEHPDLLKAGA